MVACVEKVRGFDRDAEALWVRATKGHLCADTRAEEDIAGRWGKEIGPWVKPRLARARPRL